MYIDVLPDIGLSEVINASKIAEELTMTRQTVSRYLRGDWPEGELAETRGREILAKAILQLEKHAEIKKAIEDILSQNDEQTLAQTG